MKPSEYISIHGYEAILKGCNYNLRAVDAHIKRECGLPSDYDMRYTRKKFKKYLYETRNQQKTPQKDILVNKIKEEFYDY